MARNTIAPLRSWRCPSCMTWNGPVRQFSATFRPNQVGPESPSYIDIPQPPQQPSEPLPPVKGVLPVPRDIFPKRDGGTARVTEEYIQKVTQEPAKPSNESEEVSSRTRWKQQMATLRRQNFREGVKELRDRRVERDEAAARRQVENYAKREQLVHAKEREDERLTNATTTELMRPLRGKFVLPDPDREQRVAEMMKRVQAKEEGRRTDRQYDLHALYMSARHFITTDEQLDAALDKEFGTTDSPRRWPRQGPSIWYNGLPESVQAKLNNANKLQDDEHAEGHLKLAEERIGRIAEELTGGKMD